MAIVEVFQQRLRELDPALEASERIVQIHKTLSMLRHPRLLSEHEKHVAFAALSDVFEFKAIVDHCILTLDEEYKRKAKLLIKDSLLRTTDPNTPGRDTQFELFSLACWNAAGMEARLGQAPLPDLSLNTDFYAFGAEAKRIKSKRQISKRSRKANRQLQLMKDGGILLTDLSLFFSVFSGAPDAAQLDLGRKLFDLMQSNVSRVRNETTSEACFAWAAYAQRAYISDADIGVVFQWSTFSLSHPDDHRFRHITKFTSRLSNVASNR